MLVLYIFVGIIVLIFYYIYFLNNIQENLTSECQNILDSQRRFANPASLETKNGSYCQVDADCVKVRSNYCGTKNLDLLPAPVFKTKEECENNLEPYLHLSASECIAGPQGRGWCSDSNGAGRCLVGREFGPLHQFKNPNQMCYPRQGCLNSWTPSFDAKLIWNSS